MWMFEMESFRFPIIVLINDPNQDLFWTVFSKRKKANYLSQKKSARSRPLKKGKRQTTSQKKKKKNYKKKKKKKN